MKSDEIFIMKSFRDESPGREILFKRMPSKFECFRDESLLELKICTEFGTYASSWNDGRCSPGTYSEGQQGLIEEERERGRRWAIWKVRNYNSEIMELRAWLAMRTVSAEHSPLFPPGILIYRSQFTNWFTRFSSDRSDGWEEREKNKRTKARERD